MQIKFVEATQPGPNPFNWGKFAVMRFDEAEWQHPSAVIAKVVEDGDMTAEEAGDSSLLRRIGWSRDVVFVLDLQTMEGAAFRPQGENSSYDLDRHRIWVCPLYQPFLEWLYEQDLSDLAKLPDLVEVDCEARFAGYRRPGEGAQDAELTSATSERTDCREGGAR